MNRIRRWFARLTGPPGTVRVQASQLTRPAASLPGRSGLNGFAGRFIQDVAASASVAAGHQFGRRSRATRPADGRRRPATTATMSRRRTMTALCPLPHTVQLCIHCQQRPAGFWVTPIGGATARRPWCLTCCQDLDPSRCHMVPFDAHQGEAISVNATDVTPADPATAYGGSSAGDNAASSPPAPGGGQVWLGSGELAHHRAIPLAAAWPQAGYCTGPVPKPGNGQLLPEVVMVKIDEREIADPGTGAHSGDGSSSFRRILVPVRSPGESGPALAAAARICGMTGGVLRLVHVRTYDPPLLMSGRFYLETPGEAAAVLEEAGLMAWACGGPRATTVVVDARREHVAVAIAWQAAAWPADLIVLARRPRPAISHLVCGSVPDQVMRKAACPVLAIRPGITTASPAPPDRWQTESGRHQG